MNHLQERLIALGGGLVLLAAGAGGTLVATDGGGSDPVALSAELPEGCEAWETERRYGTVCDKEATPSPTSTSQVTATSTSTATPSAVPPTPTPTPTSTSIPTVVPPTASPPPTATSAPAPNLQRYGLWGYLTSKPTDFVFVSTYDQTGAEIDSRQENISPYCAFGDPATSPTNPCTVVPLNPGTYRVEAEAHFDDGTVEEAQHFVTVPGVPVPTPTPGATSTPPPTPAPTTTPPAGAVTIPVGGNWATFISAYPAGQTFIVEPGVHRRQDVQPKTNQKFICQVRRTCIMDGEFAVAHAFRGGGSGIVVNGMVITRYATSSQRGAVDNCFPGSGSGWWIDDNEITWNQSGAVYLGSASKFTNNLVTYNGQIGLKACGSNGLFEGNEVAYNNSFCPTSNVHNPGGSSGCVSWGWEGGGSKFVKTNGLILRGNVVYGNCGPGLWADIDNINITWENNIIYGNSASGIFHEIGYKALIKGNIMGSTAPGRTGNGLTITVPHPTQAGVTRTCSGNGGAWGGAEITVNNSSNTEVTGNFVDAAPGRKGLLVLQQNRGGYLALGNWFHDNLGPDGGCVLAVSDYLASQFFAGNNFGPRC